MFLAIDSCKTDNGGCQQTCKPVGPGVHECLCNAPALLSTINYQSCYCLDGYEMKLQICEGLFFCFFVARGVLVCTSAYSPEIIFECT